MSIPARLFFLPALGFIVGCGKDVPKPSPDPDSSLRASASSSAAPEPSPSSSATPVEKQRAVPVVHLQVDRLTLDGREILDKQAMTQIPGMKKEDKIEGLYLALKDLRHRAWVEDPSTPSDGKIELRVEDEVSARVLKSVFQTCAFAGFPNAVFMLKAKAPASGWVTPQQRPPKP